MSADLRIRVQCPFCSKILYIDSEYAGKWGKCNGCGNPIEVPKLEPQKQEIPVQTPTSVDETQILCEKCGAPMENSRKLNRGGTAIGFIGFALIFCSLWFLSSFFGVGVSLFAIGITLVMIGMFPGHTKIMHCKRCGYFYEIV